MEIERVAKRKHGAEFKANILVACGQPGASVAAIVLRNGLNANIIYCWLSQSRQGNGPMQSVLVAALGQQIFSFIAVQLPESAAPQTVTVATVTTAIRMELRRGTSSVAVLWPSELAGDCRAWLRVAEMIRIEALWLATTPIDMRIGTERSLARVVQCSVQPNAITATFLPTYGAWLII